MPVIQLCGGGTDTKQVPPHVSLPIEKCLPRQWAWLVGLAPFLRLTVTPQATSENTIFLNVDVENTTPNFGQEVQGKPELITQEATTQVLVTDGGTVVIGGVIQTQNSIMHQSGAVAGQFPKDKHRRLIPSQGK
jgi:hypothetical protein